VQKIDMVGAKTGSRLMSGIQLKNTKPELMLRRLFHLERISIQADGHCWR